MPKLFQICVEGNTGSTGRIAEGLGIFVMQNGWESYIANGRFTRPSKSNLIRIGSDWEVFLHGLQTRFLDRHCLGSKWATKRLIRKIEVINPDIIHLHHLHGYYINIEILFNYLSKKSIPVVWTFHDCWSFTGHCTYFDFVGCDKWKTECFDCPQRKEYPASLIIDRSRENYHLKRSLFTSVEKMSIVSVSYWLDLIVQDSFMKNSAREVIYNGIDLSVFKPLITNTAIRDKFKIGKRFMMLGVASPWGERKGLNDFIKLSKLLGNDEFIILIGLSNKQIKILPANIIGLPKTENRQELKDLYATADLFLNLSVEETFGLTTAEALSCGTPVVVYNSTASPEIVNTDTGFVVEKHDFEGLKNSIDIVKKNGRQYYSDACRARAERLFNTNITYNNYYKLYNRLISDQNYS